MKKFVLLALLGGCALSLFAENEDGLSFQPAAGRPPMLLAVRSAAVTERWLARHLIVSARNGTIDVVRDLLERGIRMPEVLNQALCEALAFEHVSVALLLLAWDARSEANDLAAMRLAIRQNYAHVLTVMLGAAPEAIMVHQLLGYALAQSASPEVIAVLTAALAH